MSDSNASLTVVFMSTACSLTIIGATLTLFLIHWLKVKTKFSSYIRILLLSDILFSIMTISARTISEGALSKDLCSVLQYFVVFSSYMSFYWTLSFAFNTYMIINREIQDIEQYFLKHLVAAVGISLTFATVPALFDAYGISGNGGCGVSRDLSNNTAATFAIQYIPLLVCFVLIITFYGLVFYKLYQCAKEENVEFRHLKSVLLQFLPYPLILIICGTPGIVGLIMKMSGAENIDALLKISGFMYRIIGLLNSLIYGLHSETKKKLREKFSKKVAGDNLYESEELERDLCVESMRY